jgi:predicted ABC-type ATPase
MHYCQSCDSPVAMEPRNDRAVCPQCGRVDDGAALRPLFIVTGASGSGKTAVLAPLARRLADRCVTFDVDWLLDSAGALSGGQPIDWPAFRDAWLAVAHGVAQSGMPTVLLGPFIPTHLEALPARRWIGDIHFLVLDCPDDLRRARINARPHWRSRDVEEQVDSAGGSAATSPTA